MIATNLNLKVLNKKSSYNENYALAYLKRRNDRSKEDEKFFKELLNKYSINLKDEAVVDFASGVGADVKILSSFGPKTLAWHDKMEGVYKIAKENLKGIDNVTYHVGDLMDFSKYGKNTIKFGICRESVCYIGNDFLFFKKLKNILKDDGFFWGNNASLKYHKGLNQKPTLTKFRNYFFDWPLYKLTGLKLFAFVPADLKRLEYVFKKLNFNVLYLKEEGKFIEFLIKK